MHDFQATLILIAMFALRCIVPLLITVAAGYLMNRLVARWEAEDAAKKTAPPVSGPAPAATPPKARPAVQLPCWLTTGCDPAKRADCPAFQQREAPCWLARLRAEGVLPTGCPDCPVYQQAHAHA
ncbi:MAG: hypothetical protein KC425_07500 [Anaerolineales bacterium]|nr:hypothetical protein [Anaerolineales bacterium]